MDDLHEITDLWPLGTKLTYWHQAPGEPWAPLAYDHLPYLTGYQMPEMDDASRTALLLQPVQGVYSELPDGGRGIVLLSPEGTLTASTERIHRILRNRDASNQESEPQRWFAEGERP